MIAGIYRDLDQTTYSMDPCPEPSLSQSIAKILLDRSPLHAAYAHPRLSQIIQADDTGAEKYDKPKAIGNAAHALMLGRGKTIEIIEADDFRKNETKALRDAAYDAGRTPILAKHFETAQKIVASGRDQLSRHEDRDAFTNGSGEVALIWQDDGIWCRALVDWLHDDIRTVDDLKTSEMSMAPHIIGMRAAVAGWDIQAAFIERGLDILHPETAGRRRYRFIGQEQKGEPYALVSMHMDQHWLTMGRKKVQTAMTMWKTAIESRKWPGYTTRAIVPEYPGFRESQWLDREMSGEFEPDPSLVMAG